MRRPTETGKTPLPRAGRFFGNWAARCSQTLGGLSRVIGCQGTGYRHFRESATRPNGWSVSDNCRISATKAESKIFLGLPRATNLTEVAEMEFTLIELAVLILISLWGLVAMGKLLQRLSAISRTLQEVKLILQDDRKQV